jgi:hypothetical protein
MTLILKLDWIGPVVRVMVGRQPTPMQQQKTSGIGYHTTDADVRRLYDMVKEKLLAMKG